MPVKSEPTTRIDAVIIRNRDRVPRLNSSLFIDKRSLTKSLLEDDNFAGDCSSKSCSFDANLHLIEAEDVLSTKFTSNQRLGLPRTQATSDLQNLEGDTNFAPLPTSVTEIRMPLLESDKDISKAPTILVPLTPIGSSAESSFPPITQFRSHDPSLTQSEDIKLPPILS